MNLSGLSAVQRALSDYEIKNSQEIRSEFQTALEKIVSFSENRIKTATSYKGHLMIIETNIPDLEVITDNGEGYWHYSLQGGQRKSPGGGGHFTTNLFSSAQTMLDMIARYAAREGLLKPVSGNALRAEVSAKGPKRDEQQAKV